MEHQLHNPASQEDELGAALDEALGEEPRSAELRQMKAALLERRAALVHELDLAEGAATREKLRRALTELDEQIAILGEEAEITKFVEDSVRVTLEVRRLQS